MLKFILDDQVDHGAGPSEEVITLSEVLNSYRLVPTLQTVKISSCLSSLPAHSELTMSDSLSLSLSPPRLSAPQMTQVESRGISAPADNNTALSSQYWANQILPASFNNQNQNSQERVRSGGENFL